MSSPNRFFCLPAALWLSVFQLFVLTVPLRGQQTSAPPPSPMQTATDRLKPEAVRTIAPVIHTPDEPDLARETQQTTSANKTFAMIWWIPYQFWLHSAAAHGASQEKAAEAFKALKDYIAVAVVVANIGSLGSFTFLPADDVRRSIFLRDEAGNDYGPAQNIAGDAEMVANLVKPIVGATIGKMGENMQLIFFPANSKTGSLLADPTQKGQFAVIVKDLLGAPETQFQWRTPLTSYVAPRYCPVGKERVHADWNYCPWHGVPLNNTPTPPIGGVIGGIISSTPAAMPSVADPQRVRIDLGVSQGLLIKKVEPSYPTLARQARIQGTVLLQAEIGKDGRIENLTLISGHPMLVPAAIEAVKQWVYRPYLLNNVPVAVETQIQVNFALSEDRGGAQQNH